MQALTAAEMYVGGLYEHCVDHDFDVTAIRLHLASRGVLRTPAQVVDDLDHVFAFSNYAATHPAPKAVPVSVSDKAIDRGKAT